MAGERRPPMNQRPWKPGNAKESSLKPTAILKPWSNSLYTDVHVYIYICIYLFMYICIQKYTYVYIYVYVYLFMTILK